MNGHLAAAVDALHEALHEALREAGAPIFIGSKNKLVWRFPDGAVLPLTPARLRYEASRLMSFTRNNKPIETPGSVLRTFLKVAVHYAWFDHLDEEKPPHENGG